MVLGLGFILILSQEVVSAIQSRAAVGNGNWYHFNIPEVSQCNPILEYGATVGTGNEIRFNNISRRSQCHLIVEYCFTVGIGNDNGFHFNNTSGHNQFNPIVEYGATVGMGKGNEFRFNNIPGRR